MFAILLITSHLAGLTPSQVPATGDRGWVSTPESKLRKIYTPRFKSDLGRFELLKIAEEEWTRPFISDDQARLYVGSRGGMVQALSTSDGEVLWQRSDMGTIGASIVEVQGQLILGSDSDVVALARSTGETKWKLGVNGRIGGQITVYNNIAILPVRPNAFVAVDVETGEQKWRVQRQTPSGITVRGQAPATVDARRGSVYLGFSDGALMAVSVFDGANQWLVQLGKRGEFFADIDAAPLLVENGRALIVASYNGGFARINPDTGEVLLKNEALVRLNGLVDTDGGIVVGSYGDGQVLGIYAANGKVRWRYRLERGAPTPPVFLGNGLVMTGCDEGPISILKASTGRPVQVIQLASGVSQPPIHRGPFLAAMANTGLLLMFRRGSLGDQSF